MRKIFFVSLLACAYSLTSCHNRAHDHEGAEHNHEMHDDHDEDHHDEEEEDEHDHMGHHHDDDDHDHAKKGNHPDGEIAFTCEQAKEAGLKTETVTMGQFAQVIKASGKIISASGDEVTLVAPVSGVVSFSDGSLAEGKSIANGQTIAYVSSQNIAEGDVSARLKAELSAATAEYERLKPLVEDKIVTQKEFEEARLRYEQAKNGYNAVAQKSTGRGIAITSSMKGYLKNLLVGAGEYVEVGRPIAVISKNQKMQLRVDVSERYFRELGSVRSANFKLTYDERLYKVAEMGGRLVSVGKSSMENSGSVPVTFEFNNVGNIVSGAFAEVFLLLNPNDKVISIPVSALAESQGIFFVYVQHESECFVRREVKLGQNNGERVEILSGLSEGDRVVTDGSTQVRLASNSTAIPAHNHNH